jgi:trk system potassium uptake protein TrkA
VVCIGENFEANVLATVLLKKMGVRKVITRASRDIERQILREVGADELIYPEQDMATELAVRLTAKSILELIPLSATLQAAKIYAPSAFWGQSLKDLSLRSEYGINIISIYESNELRDRDAMIPHPDTVIKEGQVLLVVGEEQAIKRLSQMD